MKNKSRARLGLTGIVASLIGLSGCTGADVLLDTYAQTAARDQEAANRRAAAGFAAGAIRRAEDAKTAKEVAALGKPEVYVSQNVNVGNNGASNPIQDTAGNPNPLELKYGQTYNFDFVGPRGDRLYLRNFTYLGTRYDNDMRKYKYTLFSVEEGITYSFPVFTIVSASKVKIPLSKGK